MLLLMALVGLVYFTLTRLGLLVLAGAKADLSAATAGPILATGLLYDGVFIIYSAGACDRVAAVAWALVAEHD